MILPHTAESLVNSLARLLSRDTLGALSVPLSLLLALLYVVVLILLVTAVMGTRR